MSSILLHLDSFAGCEIDTVLTDATQVAQRIGSWIKINVNGVDVLISPSDLPAHIIKNYWLARERKATFSSANVVPNPAVLSTAETQEKADG